MIKAKNKVLKTILFLFLLQSVACKDNSSIVIPKDTLKLLEVPQGLPVVNYPNRDIIKRVQSRGDDLVFIRFTEACKKGHVRRGVKCFNSRPESNKALYDLSVFDYPYNYNKETRRLTPIDVMHPESLSTIRLFGANYLENSDKVSLVNFQTCDECDVEIRYQAKFVKEKKWKLLSLE